MEIASGIKLKLYQSAIVRNFSVIFGGLVHPEQDVSFAAHEMNGKFWATKRVPQRLKGRTKKYSNMLRK